MGNVIELENWWNEHLDEYIKDLADYVSYPSVATPQEGEYPFGKPCFDMLQFMAGLMSRYDLESSIVEKVFAEGLYKGTEGKKSLAIACHGDVVPSDGEWEWSPYALHFKEEHLVGRGSTDNKGAGIAVLYALRYLKEIGYTPKNNIKLLIGSAEEIGMPDAEIAYKGKSPADFTLVPDSGFPVAYGEKSSIKVLLPVMIENTVIKSFSGGSGVGVADRAEVILRNPANIEASEDILVDDNGLRITALGKGRHAAMPEGGEDAITKLIAALESCGAIAKEDEIYSIVKLFPDFYGTGAGVAIEDEESGKLTLVITKAFMEDGKIVFQINGRLPFASDPEEVRTKLLESIPGADVKIGSRGYRYEVDEKVMKLNNICSEVYASDRKPYIMAGGTYARAMQPAVAFGMGSPHGNQTPPYPQGQGRAHQRNESVHIDRMKKGFMIYVKAIMMIDEEL